MDINLSEYITVKEACKRYNKDQSTIARRIRKNEGTKGASIIINRDCFKIGGVWFISISRLNELYGEV